jgi:hypothetical protein
MYGKMPKLYTKEEALEVLLQYLNISVYDTFAAMELMQSRFKKSFEMHITPNTQKNFMYLPSDREDSILLCAHADTVWTNRSGPTQNPVVVSNNVISTGTPKIGIGADDRAGMALIDLFQDFGHAVLITDGEERGMIGAIEASNQIGDELNSHNFMIQFDRMGSNDFKCYNVGTDEFRRYIADRTKYVEPNRSSFTDICSIAKSICGVNFSVGYYNEHSEHEMVNINEWYSTYSRIHRFLCDSHPKFKLPKQAKSQSGFYY